jgi:hypothetical protein
MIKEKSIDKKEGISWDEGTKIREGNMVDYTVNKGELSNFLSLLSPG